MIEIYIGIQIFIFFKVSWHDVKECNHQEARKDSINLFQNQSYLSKKNNQLATSITLSLYKVMWIKAHTLSKKKMKQGTLWCNHILKNKKIKTISCI